MKNFLSFLTLFVALLISGSSIAADTVAKINFCDETTDQEGWTSVYGTHSTFPIDLGSGMTLVKVDYSTPHLGPTYLFDVGLEVDGFPTTVVNSCNYFATVDDGYTLGFRITGLNANDKYNLDVYSRGWGDDGEKLTKLSIGDGDTVTINSVLNEEVVTFEDVMPDANGYITLDVTTLHQAYAFINGIIVTRQETSTPLPTGTNIALNKPAGATSIEGSNFEAKYAFDGDLNTRWASAETDTDFETICVDLQGKYEVSAVVLSWEGAYGMAYTIDVSDDSTNWTTLFTTTEGDGEIDVIEISGTGRYIRMDATDRGTEYAYSIYEFSVYGDLMAGLDEVNVALNKPASATSMENSNLDAPFAFDGNLNTRWASAETDTDFETICVDLQGTYVINRVILSWEGAYGMAYTIDISDDSTNWTNLFTTAEGDGNIDIIELSGTGRYVRLDATDRGTEWAYSIYEFEVLGALKTGIDEVNIALNKPASATSMENSSLGAQSAFDGDMNTRWASAETDTDFETICVDLEGTYDISRVVLSWETAYGMAYTIDVSNDSVNWTTLFTTTEGDGGYDIIEVSGAGRYIRMDATDRGTPWAYSIYEFEVYGTEKTIITNTGDTVAKINFTQEEGTHIQEGWISVFGTKSAYPLDLGNGLSLYKVDGDYPHLGDFYIDDIGAEVDGFPANVQNSGNYLANISSYSIGFKISGLDPAETYKFDVYSRGWGTDGEKISKFSVLGDDTISINSVLNEEVINFTGLTPNSAGELTLSITNVSEAYAFINGWIITLEGVPDNVKEINSSNIKLYPNPASDYVQINNLGTNSTISVFNIAGKKMTEKTNGLDSKTMVDMKNLKSGIYLFRIIDKNATVRTVKVIKK